MSEQISPDASPQSSVAVTRPAASACGHCGLPADPRWSTAGGDVAFCCRGCQGAYELIRSWGLSDYYDLRDGVTQSVPIVDGGNDYDDLDDPRLLGRSAATPLMSADGRPWLRCKLSISGLHCAACVWLIEQAPKRITGWQAATIAYHDRTVEITYDPQIIKLSKIARSLDAIGYQLAPMVDGQTDATQWEHRNLLVDIAIAGFCAANSMWIAIALYAGSFTGMAAEHVLVLRIAGVLLGAIAVLIPGRVFFRSAWASLTMRTPHMDLPVAIGLAAGLIASVYGLLDIHRDIYFDSIASLVFFLLTGRWIQMRQQRRAGDEVADLMRMSPAAVSLVDDQGRITRVPMSQIQVGDHLQVSPGDSIPVDGVVTAGASLIDRSLLTGESRGVEVGVGSIVAAGTDNVQSAITVRATAVGDDTQFAAIRSAVSAAAASRTPIVQMANRIGGYFVVIVLVLAVVTAAIWMRLDPSRVVPNSVALLIVACPCALALATPLAIAVAIGRLAKRKILIRAGDCLERIARPGTLFFDKTGTLTQGRMSVTHFFGDEAVMGIVSRMEHDARHPIARAIGARWPASPQHVIDGEVTVVPGCGIQATVDGQLVRIGRVGWVSDGPIEVSTVWWDRIEQIRAGGGSPVLVARDGHVVAALGVMDALRPEAQEVIDSLRQAGWRLGILSGDDAETVQRVGRSLGLPPQQCRGGLLPDDKLTAIDEAPCHPVLMVGDGLNDAAALAAADVGIAVRGGVATSLAAAPVMIADGSLRGVAALIDASRSTRHSITKNFVVSIAYNAVAVALSMTGLISPLIAAALMPISSITVIAMTLSHPTFRGTKP